jgi:ferredoxin-thioredoxin reductase catalytic chain
MMDGLGIPQEEIDRLFDRLTDDAAKGGYNLNPDTETTKALVEGLIVNERRYGYGACPCRPATGDGEEDLDIICPCDYRDPDLVEYGTCYCSLYVSDEIKDGKKQAEPIPERRGQEKKTKDEKRGAYGIGSTELPYPVWRCKVCGYLCARENPPLVCPVCRAKQERFERFL